MGDLKNDLKASEVREVKLEVPEPITERKLKEWSDGFALPTLVRNAFVAPELEAEAYLPRDAKLFANMGAVGGFNHSGNGTYTWGELWDAMAEGKKVYGSFGTATNNWNQRELESVLELKKLLLPPNMFPLHAYAGHVIFGSTDEIVASTGWHNGGSANLVFQIAGRKLWWSTESLPEDYTPLSIQAYTNSVIKKEIFFSESQMPFNEGKGEALYESISPVILQAGDLLINPPFSWHAIKIDERNITLSLRGDRDDALVWIAYRYFKGNFDHPFFVAFCNYLWSHEYQENEPLIQPFAGKTDPSNPNGQLMKFFMLAQQYRAQRKELEKYRMKYE